MSQAYCRAICVGHANGGVGDHLVDQRLFNPPFPRRTAEHPERDLRGGRTRRCLALARVPEDNLAADLAGTGVLANAVCPGSTRGSMLAASAAVYDLSDQEDFAGQQLVRRLLEPGEVAAAVVWLCSPAASALTGAVLPVDGGLRLV